MAPGEIVSFYGQGMGPETALGARVVDVRVATSLGEGQVSFDGVAVAVRLVAGRAKTRARLVYREVASNEVELAVAAAAPGIFTTIGGQTEPPQATGVPAVGASAGLWASATIAGRTAEVLYAGAAPTLVGVAQINMRVPADLAGDSPRASVVVTIGGASSRPGVSLWIR